MALRQEVDGPTARESNLSALPVDRNFRTPITGDSRGVTVSPPESIHTYCALFLPNKRFTCFTTFHLYVEIHFHTADTRGPCRWILVPGARVARIQLTHHCSLISVSLSGNRNPASGCCRPPEITSNTCPCVASSIVHSVLFI